jgi:molecular chaperone GrpE (heat shock protein)
MNFEIALMMLATISFLLLLLATTKFYRNAKVIDTPDNLIKSLSKLEKAVDGQKSNLVKLEGRLIDKTERLYDEGFRQIHSDVHRLAETSIQVQKRLLEILGDSNKNVAEIDAQISALRQHTAEQQALLTRFQQGYDYTVNKGLISGLIRAIDNVDERLVSLSDTESRAAVNEVKDNLLIALESQNVDQFEPPVGAVYKEYMKVAQAKRQETEDADKVGKIAAVVAPGYVYVGSETEKIVKPAIVAVYVAEPGGEKGVEV